MVLRRNTAPQTKDKRGQAGRNCTTFYLDVGADVARVEGADGVRLWPLHQAEVSHGRQLHRQVGERVGGAVDDQHLPQQGEKPKATKKRGLGTYTAAFLTTK